MQRKWQNIFASTDIFVSSLGMRQGERGNQRVFDAGVGIAGGDCQISDAESVRG